MSTSPLESTNNPREGLRSRVASCLEHDILMFGTLLALVNDGRAFLTRRVTSDLLFALFVWYLALFVLALVSQVQGKRQHDRRGMVTRE